MPRTRALLAAINLVAVILVCRGTETFGAMVLGALYKFVGALDFLLYPSYINELPAGTNWLAGAKVHEDLCRSMELILLPTWLLESPPIEPHGGRGMAHLGFGGWPHTHYLTLDGWDQQFSGTCPHSLVRRTLSTTRDLAGVAVRNRGNSQGWGRQTSYSQKGWCPQFFGGGCSLLVWIILGTGTKLYPTSQQ